MIVATSSRALVNTSGYRKSFQMNVNCSVARAARAGLASGSITRQKTWPSLAPSIRAAYRSESGI